MNLTFFSGLAATLGFAALAGGLYWLQRLRVRHREVPVVTALFWREAVEETRARELRLRFRHPLAYLFILAICAALWFAAAGLRFETATERQLVLLLDGSAGMTRGTRFDDAVRRLRETLDDLPPSKRSAILCGSTQRTLLLPGEDLAWFDRRIVDMQPAVAPASIEDVLFALATTSTADRPTTVLVFGDAHLDAAALELLPDHFELVTSADARNPLAECGITALGVTPAASGDWTAVDLLVELSGSAQRELELRLADRTLEQAPEVTIDSARRRMLFRDLPANGATISAQLRGSDGLIADDRASFVLPLRRRVRVQADPALPPVVARVLTSDPAVELVESGGDVRFGGSMPISSPALMLDAALHGVVVITPADDDTSPGFLRRLDGLVSASLPVSIEVGATRSVRVGSTSLDEDGGWTQSRSFPLFIAEATRWLAGETDGPRWVAAGRAVDDSRARADAGGRVLDPVGADFTPPLAQLYEASSGPALAAALTDRATTLDTESAHRVDTQSVVERDPPDLVHWLALLAFIALLVEWVLVRRGRMP